MIISSTDKRVTNFLPYNIIAVLAGRLSAVFSTLSKQTEVQSGLANVESVYKRIFSNNEIEDLDNG